MIGLRGFIVIMVLPSSLIKTYVNDYTIEMLQYSMVYICLYIFSLFIQILLDK